MATKYILAAVSVIFLLLATAALARGGPQPQIRTWLIIGVILAAVSAWLFSRG